MHGSGDRGVSSVIGVVLVVAITVVLAAAVGAFVLGVGTDTQEPVPQIANAEATLLADDPSTGNDQQIRLTHRGGDAVEVSELEVVVRFSEHSERSRLVTLPTETIGAGDYEGDDVWDGSTGGIGGELDDVPPEESSWQSGEALVFRIASGDVSLNPGERVTVTVVHEPSGKVLLERTLTATTNALRPAPDDRSADGTLAGSTPSRIDADVPAAVAGTATVAASVPRLSAPTPLPAAEVARRTT